MSKSTLIRLFEALILFVVIISFGCGHRYYYEPNYKNRFYVPKQISVKPGMILKPEYNICKAVTIVNAQTNADNIFLGAYTHKWWANLQIWTATAVGLIENELKEKDVSVSENLPLILELSIKCPCELSIAPGNSSVAVLGSVMRGCPLDTDRDGVPDYLDQCPNTPEGTKVSRRGCPLDTDRDGVPDYSDQCPKIPQGYRIDNVGSKKYDTTVNTEMPRPSRLFITSSKPADTVMGLIKIQLEKEGIPVTEYTPKILRFITTTSKWNDAERPIRNDLGKKGITITGEAPKILRLSIVRANLNWEFKVVKCALDLKVETGDGYVIHIKETNSSIDLYDSCDGAVTRAVTAMFNNDAILRYLEAPVEPKDSDCDGVPDEIDECPGTPLQMEVDSKGCPLDTDGDGVPDYLDECPDTPEGVKVDSRGCPLDTDGDGVPDYKDQCPDTPEGVKVDDRGCPLDTDGDGVLDYMDKCLGTPKGARVDKEGCWVIDEAFFDFDKYEIKSQYYPLFDAVVSVLRNNPSLKIVIEGHTDIIGTGAYNQKLSEERAGAVMRYLLKKGIDKKRLSVVGYGFTKPRTLDKTKAGRALNRRVKLEPLAND